MEQELWTGATELGVRECGEPGARHLSKARLLPLGVPPVRVHELARDKQVHVVCQRGGRSAHAEPPLDRTGLGARSITGVAGAGKQTERPVATSLPRT